MSKPSLAPQSFHRSAAYLATALLLGLCWYACLAVFPITSGYFWPNGEYTVSTATVPCVAVVSSWLAFALLFKREIARRSGGILVMFGGASGFIVAVFHAWAYAALSLATGEWTALTPADYGSAMLMAPFLALAIAGYAAPIVVPLGIGSVLLLRRVLRSPRADAETSVRTAGAS